METTTQVKHRLPVWHVSTMGNSCDIVEPHVQAKSEFAKSQGYVVARVCYSTLDYKPTDETIAYTHLIAAAPELLDALRTALMALQTQSYTGQLLAEQKAKAAIAKAVPKHLAYQL